MPAAYRNDNSNNETQHHANTPAIPMCFLRVLQIWCSFLLVDSFFMTLRLREPQFVQPSCVEQYERAIAGAGSRWQTQG
jgi:hypothetical protein